MNRGASTRAASIRRPNRIRSIRAPAVFEALIAVWITARGRLRDVDGEAVPAEQGPPLAEGHPLERVEDVPGEEVLEPIAHPGLPRDTGRIPCVLVSLRVSHARK